MLHIGSSYVVAHEHVVAILDLNTAFISKDTRAFLNDARKKKRVYGDREESPKSLVVACDKDGVKVIYSPVSAATLRGRLLSFSY